MHGIHDLLLVFIGEEFCDGRMQSFIGDFEEGQPFGTVFTHEFGQAVNVFAAVAVGGSFGV